MASSDRGFRALAQDSPQSVVALVRSALPDTLGAGAIVTPADVDDPHLGALTPVVDADWVARVGDRDVIHVECQGYRDETFPEREPIAAAGPRPSSATAWRRRSIRVARAGRRGIWP
jgi:hypothetical protein